MQGRWRWTGVMALGLTVGCYSGTADDALVDGREPGAEDEESGAEDLPEECTEGARLGATPLRRLTAEEYNNTVRDLLGDDSRPADAFTSDELVGGFAANAIADVSKAEVEQYVDAAEQLARTAVDERLDAWLTCDRADTACVDPWLRQFGARAFRRPLTDDEHAALVTLYEDGRSQWDADTGITMALHTMLASPQFLYHVEAGRPELVEGDAVPLTEYELASRLSYFLWSTMPDDALWDAAESGALVTAEDLDREARRMLADDRARDTIDSFHRQWLGLEGLEDELKDPVAFPEWKPALGVAMRLSTLMFVQHVLLEGDARLSTLMTSTTSFINDDLAALYGVPAPDAPFDAVQLPADERAGLLSQASILTANAHQDTTSWVHRGQFVRTQLLCQTMPGPPDDVDFTVANNPDRLQDPECSGCHLLMDPIGQGLDGYDAIGAFTGDSAVGELAGAGPDVDGPFDGPVELATTLADSEALRACMADRWFVYATRRAPAEDDACSMDAILDHFHQTDGDILELLVALTQTPAFRYRRAATASEGS